uniref:peptidylprolyl isomerase n=1 Tax=Entomoneis paludosa TaxID=265537 RepID=A0A7S2Y8L7_9STRA
MAAPIAITPIITEQNRPKSKKELRAERKAARRLEQLSQSEEALQAEKRRLAKQRQKELDKLEFKALLKEERIEHKRKQQRKRNRELHNQPRATKSKKKKKSTETVTTTTSNPELEVAQKVVHEIKYGRADATSGMTTLERGVQYRDIKVGNGTQSVTNGNLITVQYQLRGQGNANVLDSSKNFSFRVGKGEVIQGWNLGVVGMKEGGKRKLLVPPKAGYGSEDIGAGSGAILEFDISCLSIR